MRAWRVRLHVRACRYLITVEDRYNHNPYHNRIHAADVLRTLHVIMTRGGIRQAMHTAHDIALLAAYFAAVVHDFEHKGEARRRVHDACAQCARARARACVCVCVCVCVRMCMVGCA